MRGRRGKRRGSRRDEVRDEEHAGGEDDGREREGVREHALEGRRRVEAERCVVRAGGVQQRAQQRELLAGHCNGNHVKHLAAGKAGEGGRGAHCS